MIFFYCICFFDNFYKFPKFFLTDSLFSCQLKELSIFENLRFFLTFTENSNLVDANCLDGATLGNSIPSQNKYKITQLILKMYKFVETRTLTTSTTFIEALQRNRSNVARSIIEFPFNNKRLKILGSAKQVPKDKKGIVYWMSRNQRVEDNWGLLYAQSLGLRWCPHFGVLIPCWYYY